MTSKDGAFKEDTQLVVVGDEDNCKKLSEKFIRIGKTYASNINEIYSSCDERHDTIFD